MGASESAPEKTAEAAPEKPAEAETSTLPRRKVVLKVRMHSLGHGSSNGTCPAMIK